MSDSAWRITCVLLIKENGRWDWLFPKVGFSSFAEISQWVEENATDQWIKVEISKESHAKNFL